MEKTELTVTVDKVAVEMSEDILRCLGMDLSSAVNIFLNMCINVGGLPFEVKYPEFNKETEKAIVEELEDMEKHPERYKSYATAEEMMESILKEE